MIDLTDGSRRVGSTPETSDRSPFRRRLLWTVGPALVGALGVLALVAWGAMYVTFNRTAVQILRAEVDEVKADMTVQEDRLLASGDTWAEAHHRLAVERVDPIFVQVFDARVQPVRTSMNVDSLGDGYPDRLLAAHTPYDWIPSPRTFTVEGRRLYYYTEPVRIEGAVVGYVQVARYLPDHATALIRFGIGLSVLWALLSVGLVGLVGWAAGRVLEPLRRITAVAETVTSADLDTRVDVPTNADFETASLARSLNALLSRLQEHVGALRAFTSNAAHELQTPLTVLRGHVEVALRRERDAASYRQTLHLLDAKLAELVRTLRALLTLTRLDRGADLDRERVDLARLTAEEACAFREAAQANGVDLRVERNAPAWVDAQPDLLREAVRNLVDNAVKYTPDGRVDVSVTRENDVVQVACVDTGIGIAPDELPQVTGRFYRSPSASRTASDGSGLGLSIVRRIVERHEGTLRATSSAAGTRFEMRFPAAQQASAQAHPTAYTPSEQA